MRNRQAVRLTQDQRNTELRRQALDQYTRAVWREAAAPDQSKELRRIAARCYFARAVLLEALGV